MTIENEWGSLRLGDYPRATNVNSVAGMQTPAPASQFSSAPR